MEEGRDLTSEDIARGVPFVKKMFAEMAIGCRENPITAKRTERQIMISFGEDADLDILSLDKFDFKSVQVAIFATTTELAKKYIPLAQKNGVKIIDASGATISEANVPMLLSGFDNDKISDVVSVPSSEVAPLLQALHSIHQQYQITRIITSVYASTNFYGRAGMDELFNQTRKIFMNDTLADDQAIFHIPVYIHPHALPSCTIGDPSRAHEGGRNGSHRLQ
jgi:aspartate-semialdehyde dehydrogenase